MSIQLGTIVDTPEVAKTRARTDVDLTPYRESLHTILLAPAGTKVIPVSLNPSERGSTVQTARKLFEKALGTMGKNGKYDPSLVKLSFRSATPGEKKPTLVYVKWAPLTDGETKVLPNGQK